jgi:hypothetical protein
VSIQSNRLLAYILDEEEVFIMQVTDARSAPLPNGMFISPTIARGVFLFEWLLKRALGRGEGECLEMCLIGNFKRLPTLTDS